MAVWRMLGYCGVGDGVVVCVGDYVVGCVVNGWCEVGLW